MTSSDLSFIRTSVSEDVRNWFTCPDQTFQGSNVTSEFQPILDLCNELLGFPRISLSPTHINSFVKLLQFLYQCCHDHSERFISILHRFFVFHEVYAAVPFVCDPKRFLVEGVRPHFIPWRSLVFRRSEIKLGLITLSSQLDVFNSCSDDSVTNEEEQRVDEIVLKTAWQIFHFPLKLQNIHVFNVIHVEAVVICFTKGMQLIIASTNFNLFQKVVAESSFRA